MIVGTGIDIVKIERIGSLIDRWGKKFLQRIFTETEISYCQDNSVSAQHFAVRFAAKEATAKMFGTGIGKVNWLDIEVKNEGGGRPYLVLKNNALELAQKRGIENIHISLSHEKDYAIAQVIAEGV